MRWWMGLANPANFADIVFCPACSLGFFVRSRKAGQMLAEMQKAKGGRPELTGDTALPVKSQPFTLAEPASQPPLPAGFFLPGRAERKCGELLRDMEKNKGAKGIGKSAVTSSHHTGDAPLPVPTLAELGIEKHQSSRWQNMRAVPPLVLTRLCD